MITTVIHNISITSHSYHFLWALKIYSLSKFKVHYMYTLTICPLWFYESFLDPPKCNKYIYNGIKKKEILLFVTIQMILEDIMLSEITQTLKNKYRMISFITQKLEKPRSCFECGMVWIRKWVILFLIFWGNSVLFSTMAALLCIPTNRAQSPISLHPWPHLLFFFFSFESGHHHMCVGVTAESCEKFGAPLQVRTRETSWTGLDLSDWSQLWKSQLADESWSGDQMSSWTWKNNLCPLRKAIQLLMEKAMAPHSSTLAWKIPWTKEPGRLQSMG